MNKEQEGIIELVGQEYTKWFYDNAVPSVSGKPILNGEGILTRGEFINKCKTNPEFSEKWGIQIEERELTDKERLNTLIQNEQRLIYEKVQSFKNLKRKTIKSCLDEKNIPTRIITITYNNKIIETYE